MAGRRLSKLQQWILKTTAEKGQPNIEIGTFILRRDLIRLWLKEKVPTQRFGDTEDEYREWRAQGDRLRSEARVFNVSLTRSIKNLHEKGLIRIFSAYRQESLLKSDFGRGLRADSLSAKVREKASAPLKRLAALSSKTDEKDTTPADEPTDAYEYIKKMAKARQFVPRELTGKKDESFDDDDMIYNRRPIVQIVALTEEGRKAILNVKSVTTEKLNNKATS